MTDSFGGGWGVVGGWGWVGAPCPGGGGVLGVPGPSVGRWVTHWGSAEAAVPVPELYNRVFSSDEAILFLTLN